VIGIGLREFSPPCCAAWNVDDRPPFSEGHHVAARMKDMMGGRDATENLHKDCMSLISHTLTSMRIGRLSTSIQAYPYPGLH
jgi:hypothetical protein